MVIDGKTKAEVAQKVARYFGLSHRGVYLMSPTGKIVRKITIRKVNIYHIETKISKNIWEWASYLD